MSLSIVICMAVIFKSDKDVEIDVWCYIEFMHLQYVGKSCPMPLRA